MAEPRHYPLAIVAGPCVMESEALCMEVAEAFAKIAEATGILPIFKSSFDKANRTSISSFRGPGIHEGLRILEKVRREVGLPVLTDVHDPAQCAIAAEVVDVLQIPAFLCRQTDLLIAAGRTGKPVNIKKGQFLAPSDMSHIAAKVESTGNRRLLLTERGHCFGYHDLVVDMRSLIQLADLGYPVIYDATHSVQSMGGPTGESSGSPRYIEPLARAAVATGAVSAVFVETHPRLHEALSDRATQLPLDRLDPLIRSLIRVIEALDVAVRVETIRREVTPP